MGLETIRNTIVAVTDDEHAEVILGQPVLAILGPEAIIVVDDALQRILELHLVLVVHRDANAQGWGALPLPATPPDVRQKALCELDLSSPAISAEPGATDPRVELAAREHKRLVRGLRPGLPLRVLCSMARD